MEHILMNRPAEIGGELNPYILDLKNQIAGMF